MVKKIIKAIVVVLGLIFMANAVYSLAPDIAENNYDLMSVLNIFNLIAWPIIIFWITGLAGKMMDWWETH